MAGQSIVAQLLSEFGAGHRQGLDHEHEEHMQVDEFYRHVGVETLESMVAFWAHYLTHWDELNNDAASGKLLKDLRDNIERIMVYASVRTIHDLAAYQQFNYRSSKLKEQDPKANGFKTMIYYAQIVTDLKADFTGMRTNVLDLLSITINDLESEDNKAAFAQAFREVMSDLGVPRQKKISRLGHKHRRWLRWRAEAQ